MTAKEDAGSVAVVTGGARGIGLGCAMALAAKGFNLALVDVLEAELKEATCKLRATGIRAAKALAARRHRRGGCVPGECRAELYHGPGNYRRWIPVDHVN